MSKFSRREIVGGAVTGTIAAGDRHRSAEAAPARGRAARRCLRGRRGLRGPRRGLSPEAGRANVVVLEARKRVGGRSWSVNMKDGTFVDFGGQWVGSTQARFYALIKEMGGETYPSPDFGKTCIAASSTPTNITASTTKAKTRFPGSKLVNDGNNALEAIAERSIPRRRGSIRTPRGSTP